MMKITLLFLLLQMTVLLSNGQEKIELYPEGIPNLKAGVDYGDNVPSFFLYKPAKQKYSTVFLVIPGGGYARVAIDHEGHDVAKRLAEMGYAALVLRYRLPRSEMQQDKRIAPLQDAQKALYSIRKNGKEWGINVGKVGVIGFSAGGHLASTLSTHYRQSQIGLKLDGISLQPDFSVLVYPVISMEDGITHKGSKVNLIGPDFTNEDVVRFSNDLNVDHFTAPTYVVHAKDDKGVPIENSYRYIAALDKNGVKNASFVYETGGHGFGMINKTDNRDWLLEMLKWQKGLK